MKNEMPKESRYGYFRHPEDKGNFPVREEKVALFCSDSCWEGENLEYIQCLPFFLHARWKEIAA